MDSSRFDGLARSLAVSKTRRGLLGTLAALGAGLIGAKAADAQVTQAQCGNVVCYNRTTNTVNVACAPGCVCCVYANGNSRCQPPGTCTGTVLSPPTTTTTAAPTTTTLAPTTTTTTTTVAPTTTTSTTTIPPSVCAGQPDGTPCGTGGACDDGRCFLAYPNCAGCGTGQYGVAVGGNGVNFCGPNTASVDCAGATCTQTSDCPPGQFCEAVCGGQHCAVACSA